VSLRCLVSTMAPINAVAAAAVTAARASVNLGSGRGLDRAIRLLDCSTVRPVLVLGGERINGVAPTRPMSPLAQPTSPSSCSLTT